MEAYVKRMCNEHKELVERINKLVKYINTSKDNIPQEIALKYYQVKSMASYEEALRGRLNLAGVTVANGNYYESAVDLDKGDKDDGSKDECKVVDNSEVNE